MYPAVLERLRQVRTVPAVSVLMPTSRRAPGNVEDPLRLRHLVDHACDRVRAEYPPALAEPVVDRLRASVSGVDFDHPLEGVAIFATSGGARVCRLPFAVPERVAVDETFAIRDLVRGFASSPRYRVLVLAEHRTRLLEGVGDRLDEVRAGGFPLAAEGLHGEPLPSGGYAAHTRRSDEQHRQLLRRVDEALAEVSRDDPLPVVVVGVERDLAYFDEVTHHRELVAGRVAQGHEHTSPHELASIVWPFAAHHLAEQRARAEELVVESIGAHRAAVGVKAVWLAARAGRGRLLVLENGYEYPARIVDDRLEPADPEEPGALDDAVDEMIEAVLASDGDVVFVEPGRLGEHGPIALALWY